MPPQHAASSSSSIPSAVPSNVPDATPKNDHRILVVVVILGIVGAFLIAFIIYTTLRVKRRQDAEASGPYQGTAIHNDHPATHIVPFGAGGPHSGLNGPRYKHNPGEDMRIALRRPDGAWHFTDSRTPFTPLGVADLDVTPSPMSSSASLISFNSRFPSTSISRTTPPPPVHHREPCREHFDDRSPY
ncbi:hypothetical protein GALMADRAFT_913495 [Galerina marginata CBS 339.88]|uniref:Uncharacterized protein n=1 Tax=Galerina marginata (strain CBS 339.88) TaxID=685588 RepID=A0A067SSV4_GALM3|nr:hypothetical protein GALMADRAFT_913495 [Galerina marginata CBS 339.88]